MDLIYTRLHGMNEKKCRLGVNIDHVATVRNARGGLLPDPLRAAIMAGAAGADIITAHLREDRRHIRDADIERLKNECPIPLNMEMAVTQEMQNIALRIKPHAICLVPERRLEITTEGGLDVKKGGQELFSCVKRLQDAGMIVSLFIDPDAQQIEEAAATGARAIELHTGAYADKKDRKEIELARLRDAAILAANAGLQVHAGHGLTFNNVSDVAAILSIEELNIGHFLIGEAIFTGLSAAVSAMKEKMLQARMTVFDQGLPI